MSILAAAIAEHDENLDILWVGQLNPVDETVAIVEDKRLGRRYLWPKMSAWHGPLPGLVDLASLETACSAERQPTVTTPEPTMMATSQKSLF